MTVIISFERYVVIAFPLRTLSWFTRRRTRVLALLSVLFSLTMAIPRYTSVYVGENRQFGRKVEATRNLEYLLMSTVLEEFFYVTLKGFFNYVDFWAPLPLLLLFNGLVYFHVSSSPNFTKHFSPWICTFLIEWQSHLQIYRYTSNQTMLNANQKSDIRAVRMFLPVVIVLFVCNIAPIVLNYYLLKGIYYRELAMGVGLSYVLNSAVNLPIYYLGGANFRKETKTILWSSFPCIASCLGINNDQNCPSSGGSSNTDRLP